MGVQVPVVACVLSGGVCRYVYMYISVSVFV